MAVGIAAGVMRRARRSAGLSQRAAAAAAGVRQPLIARIETGREQPSLATLSRLVEACGWELRIELEGKPDPGDLALIEATVTLTPQQRVDRLLAVHALSADLRQAMQGAHRRARG